MLACLETELGKHQSNYSTGLDIVINTVQVPTKILLKMLLVAIAVAIIVANSSLFLLSPL